MLTKKKAKFIKSLQIKKYRNKEQLFLVEGAKSVLELLNSDFQVPIIVVTNDFFSSYGTLIEEKNPGEIVIDQKVQDLGTFKTNNSALAVVEMKSEKLSHLPQDQLIICLDGISDPGNLGTIIRTADWYGIQNIIASEDCAEFYNPKTIQATMGSFTRVHYQSGVIDDLISQYQGQIMGAFLEGHSVHSFRFPRQGLLIIGSESHGIRPPLTEGIEKIKIPGYGKAESLNAAVATGILLDNYIRSVSEKA